MKNDNSPTKDRVNANKNSVTAWIIILTLAALAVLAAGYYMDSAKTKSSTNIQITSGSSVSDVVTGTDSSHIDLNETVENGLSKSVENTKETLPRLQLSTDCETTSYNNITTSIFTLTCNGVETHISSGYIPLEEIVSTLDAWLDSHNELVVGIGVLGSKIYIQQDAREIRENQKINIITFETSIDAYDYIELTEAIYDTFRVNAQGIFNYSNGVGDKHLIYVYNDEEIISQNLEELEAEQNNSDSSQSIELDINEIDDKA